MRAPILALVSTALGCAPSLCPSVAGLPGPADVQVIGDSVLAWNEGRCQAVGDHLALARRRQVDRRAISGTEVLRPSGADPSIAEQYKPGNLAWVVVDGGGNDLKNRCKCHDCGAVLDQIVSADGRTGGMPRLVEKIRRDGARVALIGYYRPSPKAWYGFDACTDALAELGRRYQALARAHDGVTFVDFGEVMSADRTPELYTFDWVHPSPDGSRVLAEQLARALAAP